ncbi:MAG: S-adenosylmethionine decarboxylase, partial [Prochlorococcaceae cyanobacterium]
MHQTLQALHPNPGWSATQSASPAPTPQAPTPQTCDTVGKHCILELYDCDPGRLDDQAFLRDTITAAALQAGATLLNLITHRFQPQGVTGLALLAES